MKPTVYAVVVLTTMATAIGYPARRQEMASRIGRVVTALWMSRSLAKAALAASGL